MRYLSGYIKTPLYEAWSQMRKRCNNPSHNAYHNYGGRGITICPEWDDFAVFAADMGPHPGRGWSLDREKNDQNYCKANCRWATTKQQGRNRRGMKLSVQKVAALRAAYIRGNGGNRAALSKQYRVDGSYLSNIASGRRWA